MTLTSRGPLHCPQIFVGKVSWLPREQGSGLKSKLGKGRFGRHPMGAGLPGVPRKWHGPQAGPSSGIPSKATRGSRGVAVPMGTGWVRSCLRRSLALRKALGQWGQV